jgi:hypothetical protein
LSEYDAVKILDADMNEIELEDIKDNVVLSVAETKDNKALLTAILSETLVNGVLSSVKGSKELIA